MSGAPEELESIESALRAIESVGSVVRALWALARAQLPRVEATTDEAVAYLEGVDAVIDRVAGPPTEEGELEPLHVVFGPERSFCGTLATRILEQLPDSGALLLVGARLGETAARLDPVASRCVFSMAGPASVDELGIVAERLAGHLLEHARGRSVRLLYPRHGRATLHTVVLLADRAALADVELDHYSSLARIAEDGVHESIEGHLHVGLSCALRAEIRWRVAATERAKSAVEARAGELAMARRVQMQEQVTRELGELTAALLASRVVG